MLKQKLTDRSVAKLAPPSTGLKVYRDSSMRGFGVRVLPSGTRSFVLDYTSQDGQRHMHTLGPFTGYGGGETEAARRKALLLQARIRGEEAFNPAAAKRTRRTALAAEWTVSKACEDFQAKAEAKIKRGTMRKSSMRLYGPKLKLLTDRFGTRKLANLSKDDLQNWHGELTDQIGPTAANFTLGVAKTVFAAAINSGKLDRNPAKGVERNETQSRERVLDSRERKLVWQATDSLTTPFKQIARLLLLLAQRRDEVSKMPWSELDLENRIWTLPPHRTKNGETHVVPLTATAISIIKEMPQTCEFVFSRNGKRPVSGFATVKTRLDKLAGVTGWTWHDLRRTVATGMAEMGIAVEVTERLLNHIGESRAGIVKVYQRHDYQREVRIALERWEHHLLHADQANVVKLNARRGTGQ